MGINWNQAQPAPMSILTTVEQRFTIAPRGGTTGIYNAKHGPHDEGRALDIGLNANNNNQVIVGDLLVQCFVRNQRELGWVAVVWNFKEWSANPKGTQSVVGPFPRDPTDPHTDHIHIEWERTESQQRNFPKFVADLDQMIQAMSGNDAKRGASYVKLSSG